MTPEGVHLVDHDRDLWAWFRWSVEVGENCGRHSGVDSRPSGAVIAIEYVQEVNWISVIRAKLEVVTRLPPVTVFILFAQCGASPCLERWTSALELFRRAT